MGKLMAGILDLRAEYGPNFVGVFNPLINNIKTMKVGRSTHHCPICAKPIKRKCYQKLHLAFCEVCGDRFSTWSRVGCARHPHAQGHNLKFKGTRDGWPEERIQGFQNKYKETEVDKKVIEDEEEVVQEEETDTFVPPFTGIVPDPEYANPQGLTPTLPAQQWRDHHEVIQPASKGKPSQHLGKKAKEHKQSRAALNRAMKHKAGLELEAERQAQAASKAESQKLAADEKNTKKAGKGKTHRKF
ncbi:hypothetical protein HBI24_046310 [Parastagonospora nodorum]|nr:hypothetical protein HBH50_144290 [Parastagonospora nodorum]KAH4086058.1 hypothetical protein HBH48_145580 [Parastagonospora nodorum]KAH4920200.1 hypothetical protein HBI79_196350 [Parastagonospora nodorum]KAH5589698.1 hypothetical protein HBI24_046310 [Parastagonospora nodorum]KAH6296052.1 hypothetical protein HBI39_157960 [Parastagonospora nodorum]